MAKEYIEREALLKKLSSIVVTDDFNGTMLAYGIDIATDIILKTSPAADVVEVAHGRWMHEETEDGFHIWRCSRCGRGMNGNPEGVHLYCYHCGAKMDEFLGSISTLAPA